MPNEELGDDARLAALHDTGLSAVPDPGMQRFARLVVAAVGVPVSLVSLLEPDRQVFPGLVGLGEPWASSRSTPLSHALCLRVVTTGAPLALPDTRADPSWAAHPAVTDLDVAAYAGVPLVDPDGHVLGSLCAIDTRPRQWTAAELGTLADLAEACGAELRLRIVSRRASLARSAALAAGRESDRHAARAADALGWSELLLRASQDLGAATSLHDVRGRVSALITSDLKPSYVGLVLVEGTRLRRLLDGETEIDRTYEHYDLADEWPTARAAREDATIVIQGHGDLVNGGYSDDAIAAFSGLGLHTAICVPLSGARAPVGTLVIGWNTPHDVGVMEQAVITALAGYTARAVERAQYVDQRVSIAHQLQEAMLTLLPEVDGLEIAALYRPAALGDLVGGDWYDAYPLPADADGVSTLAVTIGDISGHDIHAATLMGQVRSMLRQADLDHPGAGPARVVTALEHANRSLGIGASGTLVHLHARRLPSGEWELTWTNAGHPPPLLHREDGRVDHLGGGGVMIYPSLDRVRVEHRTVVAPGSTLLLYTDGLVEHRNRDIDHCIATTAERLAERSRLDLPRLLKEIADEIGGDVPGDDIALIALRIPGP